MDEALFFNFKFCQITLTKLAQLMANQCSIETSKNSNSNSFLLEKCLLSHIYLSKLYFTVAKIFSIAIDIYFTKFFVDYSLIILRYNWYLTHGHYILFNQNQETQGECLIGQKLGLEPSSSAFLDEEMLTRLQLLSLVIFVNKSEVRNLK